MGLQTTEHGPKGINLKRLLYICVCLSWCIPTDALAEPPPGPLDGRDGRPLALDRFRPRSMLKVPEHLLTRARFPVVDVHTHPGFRLRGSAERLDEMVRMLDRHNIAVCVSLDARLGSTLDEHFDYLWSKHKDRFVVFVHIDWRGEGDEEDPSTWDCNRPDFPRRIARALRAARDKGASGLKIFKRFGLRYRNADGSLIEIDDPRWNPIWETCGQLGMPVLMHIADPAAFFLPIDETNERWEELHRRPEWGFYDLDGGLPGRDSLLAARNRVFSRHPQTIFIGAHLANNPEDLQMVAKWLEQYPNLYVEIASRIGELGRQPYSARKFFIKHADRILFGTDGPWPPERVALYWRFLETFDEYFPYSEKAFPPQGFWNIYGIGLPDDVLEKIYFQNAARIVPGVQERLEQRGVHADEDGQ